MRTKPTLELADVKAVVEACKAEANKNGWKISIAVVDEAANLLYFERQDGVKLNTIEVAIGKAKTAALGRSPSANLENLIKDRPSILKLSSLPMQGGMPLMYQGECVGGVGVSGPTFEQDEQISTAGAKAIG